MQGNVKIEGDVSYYFLTLEFLIFSAVKTDFFSSLDKITH